MTSVLTAKLPSLLRSAVIPSYFNAANQRCISLSAVDWRARKGTREKAKKKKVKVEVKKVDFITRMMNAKDKNKDKSVQKPEEDDQKTASIDDVWPKNLFKWKVYSVSEAIKSFKENNHPSVYNMPNELLKARIELSMIGMKKTRVLDNFTRLALIPHGFERENKRSVLVFCRDQTQQREVMDAGATFAGGVELVKGIQKGDFKVTEYEYILAHPDILMDIVPLRGILKRKFPQIGSGSVNADLIGMVNTFMNGIQYRGAKHDYEPKFGLVEAAFGRLSMDTQLLEENFVALLKDVDRARPKREGLFITRCFLECSPSAEKLKINPFVYIKSGVVEDAVEEQSDDEKENKDVVDSDDEDVKVATKA